MFTTNHKIDTIYFISKITIKFFLLVALFLLAPSFISEIIAQPPPPAVKPIPVDGGAVFLVAAGVVYGLKKMNILKKKP